MQQAQPRRFRCSLTPRGPVVRVTGVADNVGLRGGALRPRLTRVVGILLLRFFGGLTQTEIGAQVGLSQMHVSRLLARTLTRLRHQLIAD